MKLSGNDIRKKFIQYFRDRHGHLPLPSASLIPANPTVLLTPAGMLPFVPIFLGIEPPPSPPRVVSVQKCARVTGKASDLEYVGRTSRHHTFFEMLGNFSFGDYFKEEAIAWAWEFVTECLGLSPDRLWVTVYHTDEEARKIWEEKIGVAPERVLNRGEKDNFWGPPGPTGPCGPCSEIFVDRGERYACSPECSIERCECDRYMEIWNLVFMELFKDAEGKTSPLEKRNVDTGMGLERIAMVLQGVDNTFETDLLFPILKRAADLTGHRYHEAPDLDIALKIVTDHLRCVTFAIGDGIVPSNEGRGYVIRMILRRGIRYAKKLGMREPMLFKLVSTIRDLYQEIYPELKTNYNQIVDTIKAEEKRFLETLERGSRLLDEAMGSLKASGQSQLSGEDAFKLYDTYGFPLELTQEIAQEQGFTVDREGFEQAMKHQRERARAAQGDKTLIANPTYGDILQEFGPTRFLGYDTLESEAEIVALIHNGQRVERFEGVNQPFEIVLNQTPFYAESGGQAGDRGILYIPAGQKAQTVVVMDTKKIGDLHVHQCLFDQGGSISVGLSIRAEVDPETRMKTARHHSATHLLHAALKKQLGEQVGQAGSFVGTDGARFDFTFPRALKADEIRQIEMLVNQWILENIEQHVQVTDVETARQEGAVAMFNEKYGDQVRLVHFGPYSKELCGGTHVARLGDIGLFKITSESAVASGIRRLEYIAGELALRQITAIETEMEKVSSLLKVPQKEAAQRVERLLEEKKALEKTLKSLYEQRASAQVNELLHYKSPEQNFLVAQVNAGQPDTLKLMVESLARHLPQDLLFLGANIEGRAYFAASVPAPWIEKGVKAGDLVKKAASLCEGGGGGKPNFAQAGGKLGNNVKIALDEIEKSLKKSPEAISG